MKRIALSALCLLMICLMASCAGRLELEGLRDENGGYLPMPGLAWGASASELEKCIGKSLGKPLELEIGKPAGQGTDIYIVEGPAFNGCQSRVEYDFRDGELKYSDYYFLAEGNKRQELFDSFVTQLKELYGEPYDSSDFDNGSSQGYGHIWRQEQDGQWTVMSVAGVKGGYSYVSPAERKNGTKVQDLEFVRFSLGTVVK